jgi:uncharacterized membrane protein
MAGIGFELTKILRKRSYGALAKAYTYAGVVGNGPWLIAVLCLGALGVLMARFESQANIRLFFVSISFVYALTLILTGPVQVIVTRFAADKMFLGQNKVIFPTFVATLSWTCGVSAVVGLALFVGFVPGPMLFRLSAALLMVLVSGMWVTGIFLTVLKNYSAVLIAFAAGFLWSLVAATAGAYFNAGLAMFGLAFGHALLLGLLFRAVFLEVGEKNLDGESLLPYFGKYWDLALGGLLYNVGIWGDKLLFWWVDPGAEHVGGILYAAPVYDKVVYFSLLTIVPGMAVFLLKLETEFAAQSQLFIQHVLRKGTLAQILEYQREMIRSLRDGFTLLLKVQGLCTGLLLLCTNQILPALGLGAVQSGVFQVSLLGVFLLVIMLSLMTVLYYLDKRRDAMVAAGLFASLNIVFTLMTIQAGQEWHGFGFLLAIATAVGYSMGRVNKHLRNLDYDTFVNQPLYG